MYYNWNDWNDWNDGYYWVNWNYWVDWNNRHDRNYECTYHWDYCFSNDYHNYYRFCVYHTRPRWRLHKEHGFVHWVGWKYHKYNQLRQQYLHNFAMYPRTISKKKKKRMFTIDQDIMIGTFWGLLIIAGVASVIVMKTGKNKRHYKHKKYMKIELSNKDR
jgi:hypothetical protein